MIDVEKVDRMFEIGRTTGAQVRFRIFDRNVLLPLPQLLDAVSHEAGQTISEAELRIMAGHGWIPLLKGAGVDGSDEGSPFYAPDRIGLFLKLQHAGYTTDELTVIAHFEEWMIDNALTTDDLAYVDDDLETLILHAQARIASLESRTDKSGGSLRQPSEIDRERQELALLQNFQANGVPERLCETVAKQAFRMRAFNEMTRIYLFELDRSKIAAEYSPFVAFSSKSWSEENGVTAFKAGSIIWRCTVEAAIAYGDASDIPPIRVPGFLLRGDRVIPTRTLRPAEYAEQWKERDLDAYLECWAELRGERRCLNCFVALQQEADDRKRFCGEKCRNAAKQRRHRERNPDSVERAQRRYWQSLDS